MKTRKTRTHDKEDDDDEDEDEDDEDEELAEQMLDGMPESFIGPLLADLVSHEVGHTLGLRHNFKASSIYSIDEINSEELKGKKPLAGSVMDYLPTNFKVDNGEIQGDYAMIGVGPYDMWAIEYGYTLKSKEKQLKKILSRVAEPQLAFATDEDTRGPDPLARRYDFGKEPLNFAKDQISLAQKTRKRILDDFVKDGDSWYKARRGYLLTLALQTRASSMMANWLGGVFVNRDKKGDPKDRKPIEVVPAKEQRDALNFVVESTFFDDVYGLTPELADSHDFRFLRRLFQRPGRGLACPRSSHGDPSLDVVSVAQPNDTASRLRQRNASRRGCRCADVGRNDGHDRRFDLERAGRTAEW